MRRRNFGLLLEEKINPKHWRFGGYTGIVDDVVVDNWLLYLPDEEDQRKLIDSMGCVSFATNNALETIFIQRIVDGLMNKDDLKWLTDNGYIVNGIPNFSDRYLAKMSGTTTSGNYFYVVGDTLREYGAIPETLWPFEGNFTWGDYYADIDVELIELGKEFAKRFPINYEFLNNSDIPEAIKYSPLVVGVYAWPTPVNGKYPRGTRNANHAVEGARVTTIYDTYNPYIKELEDNYNYGAVVKYHVNFNKKETMIDIKNNTLVQEVEKSGQFGLALDGKIIIDDNAKVILTYLMRNSGDIKDKTMALNKAQWDEFPKINLKRESIGG
jgi:hypothetical protein